MRFKFIQRTKHYSLCVLEQNYGPKTTISDNVFDLWGSDHPLVPVYQYIESQDRSWDASNKLHCVIISLVLL